jgi:hypothetical protein
MFFDSLVEFRRLLENDNALRVHFEIERAEIYSFVVQLECFWKGKWKPVVRYDTAHGFAHRDKMVPGNRVGSGD